MSGAAIPRVVIVTRGTEYEAVVAEHGTRNQAAFVLAQQGVAIDVLRERHERFTDAVARVGSAIPNVWRRVRIDRAEVDRFVFERDDIIAVVGQDGLVANVAKYLDGQSVIGVNPDPALYEGVLVAHPPESFAAVLQRVTQGSAVYAERTMVDAETADGQRLSALNEIFIGHRSHQSARYELAVATHAERQSSSGVVVSTGTGSTGWARSLHLERRSSLALPRPEERRLAFFVREAFPGSGFSTALTEGELGTNETLRITSLMNAGGVSFGDGIEDDRIELPFGTTVTARISRKRLRLVA